MDINNNIQPDYCSFETHVLLREKGMEIKGNQAFKVLGHIDCIEKVEHWKAIKWIRENFKWNIEVKYKMEGNCFFGIIYPMLPNSQVHYPGNHFNSNEEATEAALLYTLKNLI